MTPSKSDPLSHFHPVVARWWRAHFRRAPGSPADQEEPAGGGRSAFQGGSPPAYARPTDAQVRGWAAIRSGAPTLIAAPTGSGKTLAAFLNALNGLLQEGLAGELTDETRVLYVSPLKALSADIHRNLAEPRREIRRLAEELGLPPVRITAAMRTGDTAPSERQAMVRRPPHILVTTPESLYLLLTAERSRSMLRSVRTVIVDEIHALVESRRGSHLALSLERLEHLVGQPLQRIGLSATQNPIDEVARFLVGNRGPGEAVDCEIIDAGHLRDIDLALELPGSPLESVLAAEAWQEIYERLTALIEEHRTTLIFVNTRRLAERVARSLSERLGEAAVTAHHGSLAKEVRLDAEERLKAGGLRALVATASLELGIDIGAVDLVCQLGSPRRVATLLQRVGRSGHQVGGRPKGRLFPLTRDDLVECTALLGAVQDGVLDRIRMPPKPLDVLAQQLVAAAATEEWAEEDLFALARRAYPYRHLEREEFAAVVQMVARGFATRRGRRGAFVHYDAVNGRIRGRKGARLAAITSGGAIPEIADYRVELEPEGLFVGTLNEDFAVESAAGDVFQLGNTSWRILRVQTGVVRVQDAHGEPPTIPFWLGEAPARSDELSAAVSALRAGVADQLAAGGPDAATAWLAGWPGVPRPAAEQIVAYLAETRRILGAVPTQRTLVLERFFDEAGGMQLVLHAPFGGRVNRAWGLALRKKFCRSFNFELQAAATDEGLLLSLGPQHSFPLDDVFRYLQPATVANTLVQAVLDAPLFQTRWRWSTTLSLAVLRQRGGRRVAPQIQRMQAEDLLAAVFPDAAACLENIAGDREVPDHPLVRQTLDDCLVEAMDLPRLEGILQQVLDGDVRCVARDTPEPSPLCHEILNARPYAFLDDAPLEERRTQAVYTRRALEPTSAGDLGALDAAAIARVREEAAPAVDDADTLHDALLTCGFLGEAETAPAWVRYLEELADAGRAARAVLAPSAGSQESGGRDDPGRVAQPRATGAGPTVETAGTALVLWIAAERLPELQAVHPDPVLQPPIGPAPGVPPPGDRGEAIRTLLRSRMEFLGPTTVVALAASLEVTEAEAEAALLAMEAEGGVLRGAFTPGHSGREWCDRRLLARIHRYTLNRLRAEIEPVSTADLMRFLFRWQRLEPEHRAAGLEGLAEVVSLLAGMELPAAAWEADVFPARVDEYDPELLDMLCLSGRVVWGRWSPATHGPSPAGPLRTSGIAILPRAELLPGATRPAVSDLSAGASQVRELLQARGASFFAELVSGSGLLATQVEQALGELVAVGQATADSFAGLRALLTPSNRRQPFSGGPHRRRKTTPYSVETAGRWSLLPGVAAASRAGPTADPDGAWAGTVAPQSASDPARAARSDPATLAAGERMEQTARRLLRRWGVVCRRLLAREIATPPWRELVRVYRRLEARGEIRGGRFVAGFSGEQFALPEAVGLLRAVRREERRGVTLVINAADPLNLTGIVTPGERIPAVANHRIAFRDGVPVAVLDAEGERALNPHLCPLDAELQRQLVRQPIPPALRAYLRPAAGRSRKARRRDRAAQPGRTE